MSDETNYGTGTGQPQEPVSTGWTTVPPGTATGSAVPPAGAGFTGGAVPPPPGPGAPGWTQQLPNPTTAGWLGLIPGVGAMYNGQFAKGIAHIVIFVLLDALSKASSVFDILVFGWICYMAFEAYHTAKARREGLPLPDAFGLNDIGERLGVKGTWTGGMPWHTPRPPQSGQPQSGPIVTPPPAGTATASQPYAAPGPPQAPGPFDPGYGAAYNPAPPIQAFVDQTVRDVQTAASSRWQNVPPPYAPPAYVPPTYAPPTYVPSEPLTPPPPAHHFPTGAVWLIGLGVVFLLLTLTHGRINFADIAPFLLGALGIWLFARKMLVTGGLTPAESDGEHYGSRFAYAITGGGGVLVVIAVLLGLQQFGNINMGRSWPVLLIAVGVLLLVRRAATPLAPYTPAPVPASTETQPLDQTKGGL